MRIAEYKQVGVKIEQRQLHHDTQYDEVGNIILDSYDEIVDVEVPDMQLVYRDATQEEEEEALRMQAEMPEPEPTVEEQLSDLTELVGILTEVICND